MGAVNGVVMAESCCIDAKKWPVETLDTSDYQTYESVNRCFYQNFAFERECFWLKSAAKSQIMNDQRSPMPSNSITIPAWAGGVEADMGASLVQTRDRHTVTLFATP
jgi:hypothetical protein